MTILDAKAMCTMDIGHIMLRLHYMVQVQRFEDPCPLGLQQHLVVAHVPCTTVLMHRLSLPLAFKLGDHDGDVPSTPASSTKSSSDGKMEKQGALT